ncbi:hypothetical protein AAVH_11216 [Aphelenchoides avenae]|nr:hypothetical protein AAVH_11216 [Aphelenchus avenae]
MVAARRQPFRLALEVLEDMLSPSGVDGTHAFSGTARRFRRYYWANAHRLPERLLRINMDLRNGRGEVVHVNHPPFRIRPAAHRQMGPRALRSGRVERVRIHSVGGYPAQAPTAARRLFRYRRHLIGAAVNIVDMPGNIVHCAELMRACALASHIDFSGPPTRSANWLADAAGQHLHLIHQVYITRMHTFDPMALVDWLMAPSNSERAIAIAIGCPLTFEAFWHLIVRVEQDALVQHRVQLHVGERPDSWGILPIELERQLGWSQRNTVQNPRTLVRWTYGQCETGATLTIDP